MPDHPFLDSSLHVAWSQLTADRVVPDIRLALSRARDAIDRISSQDSSSLTYESTFLALEHASEDLDRGWGRLQHLDSVDDQPARREALNQMLPEVTEFYASIALNAELWNVLKLYGESSAVAELDPVRQRFVRETLEDFRQAGADLPSDQKSRIAAIESTLSKLTKQYAERVLDSTNAWELVIRDESKLAGLPASAVASAASSARQKGLASDTDPAWRFTLHFPSMFPVMQYLDDEEIRRQVWEASVRVGGYDDYDNTELVWQILELRDEKARILGHDHFADFALFRRMAKSGQGALSFVEQLHERVKPSFVAECRQLQQYKAAKTGGDESQLEPWETAYWAERQRQENYSMDDEELRPYFPVEGVMAGMFQIAAKLFGITITQQPTFFRRADEPVHADAVEVWHPEVSFYEIHDSDTGRHLGSFYADWHPRESKRGGAWMNSLHTGAEGEPHLGLIVGNMSPPIDGKPALLTHSEVETIFHEFGHLLHGMLSDVPVKSLSGTHVPWDFVELPSQIMENFCWHRESLDFFARHHESGEPIPDDLFNKMMAARNYLSASAFMRQLSMGKLDLELHINFETWQGRDLDEIDREILVDYRMPMKTLSPSMLRRFGHLFSSPLGYAAGYYSYKWAEVLDADAFTRFQNEGVLNASTGRAFRDHILSQGNSAPVDELFRRFMGRDPELDPLLVRAGIVEPRVA